MNDIIFVHRCSNVKLTNKTHSNVKLTNETKHIQNHHHQLTKHIQTLSQPFPTNQ